MWQGKGKISAETGEWTSERRNTWQFAICLNDRNGETISENGFFTFQNFRSEVACWALVGSSRGNSPRRHNKMQFLKIQFSLYKYLDFMVNSNLNSSGCFWYSLSSSEIRACWFWLYSIVLKQILYNVIWLKLINSAVVIISSWYQLKIFSWTDSWKSSWQVPLSNMIENVN